jgi:hypothetical protein
MKMEEEEEEKEEEESEEMHDEDDGEENYQLFPILELREPLIQDTIMPKKGFYSFILARKLFCSRHIYKIQSSMFDSII